MRTLAITQNITVDGSIEMLDDWFDPTADDADVLAESHAQDARCDAVLLGRQTFIDFRGYWPLQEDDRTGITDYLDRTQKYVVSSTLDEPGWQNSTIIDGDALAGIAELKSQPGQDIVCTGSITLSHALLEAGLVDELRLFTYPVVQGRGRRLFPEGQLPGGLRLLDAMSFAGGITLARYAIG